jgi:hypothetical protein
MSISVSVIYNRKLFSVIGCASIFALVCALWASRDCIAAENHDVREVLALAKQSIDGAYSDSALKLLAVTQVKAGDLTGALISAAGRKMLGDRLDSYGEIASVAAESGDMKGVRQVLNHVKGESSIPLSYVLGLGSQIDARAHILGPIAQIFVKKHQVSLAQECVALLEPGLFESSTNMSKSVLANAWSDIAEEYARAKDMKRAVETALRLTNQWGQALALARIAAVQAEFQDISGALATGSRIPSSLSANGPLPIIIKALVRAGAIIEAKDLVRTHLDKARTLQHESARNETLKHLAGPQAMTEGSTSALQTADTLSDKPLSPMYGSHRDIAMQAIAMAEAERNDFRAARDVTMNIHSDWTRDETLKDLSARLAQTSDIETALDTAMQIRKVLVKDAALIALIQSMGEMQRISATLGLPSIIQNLDNKATALSHIAKYQARTGDIASALKTLGTIQKQEAKDRALQSIVEEQITATDLQGASQISSTIQTEPYRSNALGSIAVALVIEGDIATALKMVDSAHEGYRDNALQKMARAHAEKGSPEEALAWATARPKPYERFVALVGVSEGILSRKGN